MPDKAQQKRRTNRVFKSLHKPLTYLGVERTLFYFDCLGAVGDLNLFNSILAAIAVFIGRFASAVGLQAAIRRLMLRLDKVIKPWKKSAALNDRINLDGFWNMTTFLTFAALVPPRTSLSTTTKGAGKLLSSPSEKADQRHLGAGPTRLAPPSVTRATTGNSTNGDNHVPE
jgi:hypothetical protein